MKPVEYVTPLSQQSGVEDLHTEVPRAFVDRRSFVRGFDIDLNIGCVEQYGGGAKSTWMRSRMISMTKARMVEMYNYTFHIPCGECTITLKDIDLQPNLPIDGEVVIGPVTSVDWSATCEQLVGKVSNKFRGSRIEMGWLEDNFKTIEASASDIDKEQFLDTFILRLTEGLLMSDKSQNLVHLIWLLLLVDLKEVRRLSWGSTVLTTLHREMVE
ncbi:hypothetical protein Gohar_020620 [Gossypium harknessii]|uniref:Aminotransferase-like plant mobile domain-containing protein n=1 Tax=Gossypium harknessii TaxID=34285 RepID=A0A7J9HY76_9ROSI|nr:hypothetical protein [Gossypium harknessii]